MDKKRDSAEVVNSLYQCSQFPKFIIYVFISYHSEICKLLDNIIMSRHREIRF